MSLIIRGVQVKAINASDGSELNGGVWDEVRLADDGSRLECVKHEGPGGDPPAEESLIVIFEFKETGQKEQYITGIRFLAHEPAVAPTKTQTPTPTPKR